MEEEEAIATTTYWCHMCSRTVNPLMEAEIKCPFCSSGFIEEMAEEEEEDQDSSDQRPNSNSLLPPILMQLMNDIDQSVDDHLNENESGNDLDSQLQAILRRRRERPSVSIVQLLQGVRAASTLEHGVDDDSERGRLVQIIAVPSSVSAASSSLSDYFIGPDFEALLQHLAENDPNRHGTPPARKDAVEALASVIIQEASLQCSVCLDDLEIGMETKEMPCKHKFHGECLLPWLELHSSCPVCRYQLPSDETKTDSGNDGVSESSSTSSSQGSENNHPEEEEEEEEEEDDGGEESGWLFRSFFSSFQGSNDP